VQLYQKACGGGEMTGCRSLGWMYDNGRGVEKKDEQRAVQLYQKACDGGFKQSCQELPPRN
jgi:hypothetical protein